MLQFNGKINSAFLKIKNWLLLSFKIANFVGHIFRNLFGGNKSCLDIQLMLKKQKLKRYCDNLITLQVTIIICVKKCLVLPSRAKPIFFECVLRLLRSMITI